MNKSKKAKSYQRHRPSGIKLVDYNPEIERGPFEFNRSLIPKLNPPSSGAARERKSKQTAKPQEYDDDLITEGKDILEVTKPDCFKSELGPLESKEVTQLEQIDDTIINAQEVRNVKLSSSSCKTRTSKSERDGPLHTEARKESNNFGYVCQDHVKYTSKKMIAQTEKRYQFKRITNFQKKTKKSSGRHVYKIRHRVVICKMKPVNIRFTNTQFTTKFVGINKTIYDTLQELQAGLISIENIPKLTVFRYRGKNYSLNNKRLFVFKRLAANHRKHFNTDIIIPVLFHETLNLVKASRTFGCAPANISQKSINEKGKNARSSKKMFYVRSTRGRKQMCITSEQSRMKKADLRRCRNGDEDFVLFSVTESENDVLCDDAEDDAHLANVRSRRGRSEIHLPTLAGYIQKAFGVLEEADIECIPDPIVAPTVESVDYQGRDLIFIDIKTNQGSEIIQISAAGPNGIFERYVQPKRIISEQTSNITRIKYKNGQMFHNGKKVENKTTKDALTDFIRYLNDKEVMLIAHNARNFHSSILYKNVKYCGLLQIFKTSIHGFIDTMPMMKAIRAKRPHTLCALYEHFFHETLEAHNATEDVLALKRIYELNCIDIEQFTFSWNYINEKHMYYKQTMENFRTWQPMIISEAISKTMARKASASGLKLCHVMKAFAKDESEGVKNIFSKRINQQEVRVTKSKRIIQGVCEFLKQTMTQ